MSYDEINWIKDRIISGDVEKVISQLKLQKYVNDFVASCFDALVDLGETGIYYKEIIVVQMEMLAFLRGVLPSGDPNIFRAMSNLAVSYNALAQYEEALSLNKRVLNYFQNSTHSDYIDIVISTENLAISYLYLGNYEESLRLNKEVLSLRQRILPADHKDIASSMENLAFSYGKLGWYGDSLRLNKEVLALRQRILPADHKDIALSMHHLAIDNRELGFYEESLKLNEDSMALFRKILPPDHLYIALSLESLGLLHHELENYIDSVRYYKKARSILKCIFPKDHYNNISIMMNLAASYRAIGNKKKALKTKEAVFLSIKLTLPHKHPLFAAIMNNLSLSYRDSGKFQEAAEIAEKALLLRQSIMPADHIDIAQNMGNLALIYKDMGQNRIACLNSLNSFSILIQNHSNQFNFLSPMRRSGMENWFEGKWSEHDKELKTLKLLSNEVVPLLKLHVEHLLTLKGLNAIGVSLRPTLLAHASEELRPLLENLFAAQGRVARLTLDNKPEEYDLYQKALAHLNAAEDAVDVSEEGRVLRAKLRLDVLTIPDIAATLPNGGALLSFSQLQDEAGQQHWFAAVVHQDEQVSVQELTGFDTQELTQRI